MLDNDIARVDNSIKCAPLSSNIHQAWQRIKKHIDESEIPSTSIEGHVIWSDNKCNYCTKRDLCNKIEVCEFVGRKLSPVSFS